MNTQRMLILGLAAIAAGAAAFLARGFLGGGTEKSKAAIPAPHMVMSEVLVAANNLQAGTALTPESVRWQQWPRTAVDPSFITHDGVADLATVVHGVVVRVPLLPGEPLTTSNIVHAASAGFMAARVGQGLRAVSIGISTESGAGGFILPNDRVDVLVTVQISDNPRRYAARTLLNNVRVLAVDQTYREDKDQKVVLAKTATLELTPQQAEQVERAQATGTISLSLRPLGDADADNVKSADATVTNNSQNAVAVIRYGITHTGISDQGD